MGTTGEKKLGPNNAQLADGIGPVGHQKVDSVSRGEGDFGRQGNFHPPSSLPPREVVAEQAEVVEVTE